MKTQKQDSRIEYYLDLFEQVKARVDDDHIAMAIVEQVAKDARIEKMARERQGQDAARAEAGEQPATEKQLSYLEALGVEVRKGLTKQEASRLIDEAQEKDSTL